MRVTKCIFCGECSTNSKSVEHIIPESLGNKTLILEKGVVCDKCNNYFSRKIEGPVLSLDGFKRLRFYNFVQNKAGNIPISDALFCGDLVEAKWEKVNGEYSLLLGLSPETICKMINNPPKYFFTRGFDLSDDENHRYEISRFIAKVAIEYYVYLFIENQKDNDDEELIIEFDKQLSKLVNFVRVGRSDKHPLNYEVCIEEYSISIGFIEEKEDLVFLMRIMNTTFKLNLSNNSGLE